MLAALKPDDFIVITSLILLIILFLGLVTSAISRRSFGDPATRSLIVYFLGAFLWEFFILFLRFTAPDFLGVSVIQQVLELGSLLAVGLLALLYLAATTDFLPIRFNNRIWLFGGGVWLLVVFLSAILFPPDSPKLSVTLGSILFAQNLAVFSLMGLGWLLIFARTIQITIKSYRLASRPLHKNRISFWLLSILIALIGDLLAFWGFPQGVLLRIFAGCIGAYVLANHYLPDMLHLLLRGFSLLLITLLNIVVYAIGFIVASTQLHSSSGLNIMRIGLYLGILLAVGFNPLIYLLFRRMDQKVFGLRYDPSLLVREYSLSISNIIDLDFLTKTALTSIARTFPTPRSYLFLVDETREEGHRSFTLSPLKGSQEEQSIRFIELDVEQPVAAFFSSKRLPLTQYDLDFLPEFTATPLGEREWFERLEGDVFVPIWNKVDWIGLLVLGPKSTGQRYYPEELSLLTTLAEQTAVAIENARLFASLMRVNKDLVQAQRALEEANRQLREADEEKSAFIGVITHELRTPLANISFSMQLLGMYGIERLSPQQREQVEQVNGFVKQSKRMVENLITFATFINKQATLNMEPIDFEVLINDTLLLLEESAREKGVALKVDVIGELLPVLGDRKYLADAIYQLVQNAVKFTKPKGKIWISCWNTSNAIFFDVKDTGTGVPREKLPIIWNSFTQSADSLRRGLEGLGLGLAIVKYIVAAHGGQVWAESWEGKGSVFGFQVPLEPLESVAASAEPFQIRNEIPHPQGGYSQSHEKEVTEA